jgi:transglutaminase-like putative cysteine protease
MRFDIAHILAFRYSAPACLELLTVRLRPRCDGTQRLLDHAFRAAPEPAGQCPNVDLDGNATQTLWFEGTHTALRIEASSRVDTSRANPFDFVLLDPQALSLPMAYSTRLDPALEPYRRRDAATPNVDSFARDTMRESNHETLPFLSGLTERIASLCRHVVREKGEPMPPAETLKAPQAACRDLTVLAMDACRAVGLAVRFVTGYQYLDATDPRHHLHAWFEVYLPGAGWRGYDASNGLAVSDRHVALCAAADPRQAAPTSGTFRGTGVTSTLHTEIQINARSRDPLEM